MSDRLDRARTAAAAVLGIDADAVDVRVRGQGRGGGRPHARTDEQIRAAVAVSASYRGAARMLGISDSTVRDACERLGIAPKSAPIKEIEKKNGKRAKTY